MIKQAETLLILIPGFPTDENDTTCLPSQQLLVRKLNECFPTLNIIILAFQYPFKNKQYEWFGNTVIPLNGQNKRKLHRLLLWRKSWKQLKQLHQKHNVIGIFSCWCSECALVGKYFSKKYSLKHFIWICGQDASKKNKLVKYIKPQPGSLIAISDFLVKEFQKNHGVRPLHMIPIGINTALFNLQKRTIKEIDILAVGSLIPLKRFEIFVDIIDKLKNYFPKIKAVLCGSGPDKERLQQLVVKKQLQNNISFKGNISHAEVLYLMQQSKALLHPSAYEGFGAVCMEALYAGAYVISFCKPLDKNIPHWYIAKDAKEMFQYALSILNDENNIDFSPVIINDVKDSAVSIMNLFGYNAH